jgi:hypothetical protein
MSASLPPLAHLYDGVLFVPASLKPLTGLEGAIKAVDLNNCFL